jgi:hypothetical protein
MRWIRNWEKLTRWRFGLIAVVVGVIIGLPRVHGDLIRSNPARSFPGIAGDIVGLQTYRFDPETQTGTFEVQNAPHLVTLGPSAKDMFRMLPKLDGTLTQSLSMKLDRNGRLVQSPDNKFEIHGRVTIGDRTYQGLLLEATPTAFGAGVKREPEQKKSEVFDLNMTITGGELAEAFGSEAYMRIVPQSGSTFNGEFTADFSSEKPMINLQAKPKNVLPAPVPEPSILLILLTCGAGLIACRLRRHVNGVAKRPHSRAHADVSANSVMPDKISVWKNHRHDNHEHLVAR